MDVCLDVWMDGWMDVCMYGWMDVCMYAWTVYTVCARTQRGCFFLDDGSQRMDITEPVCIAPLM